MEAAACWALLEGLLLFPVMRTNVAGKTSPFPCFLPIWCDAWHWRHCLVTQRRRQKRIAGCLSLLHRGAKALPAATCLQTSYCGPRGQDKPLRLYSGWGVATWGVKLFHLHLVKTVCSQIRECGGPRGKECRRGYSRHWDKPQEDQKWGNMGRRTTWGGACARCTVMHRSCRVSKCRELVHHGVRKAEGGLTASSGAGRTESSCANTKHCVFRQVIIL